MSARVLAGRGLGVGWLVLAALVAAGLKTGLLDREVLTQSTMSLRYRWEYWQGAWGVITGGATSVMQAVSSPFFWWGVGPGNFGGPYLKYKLPQSSEEILDPHNLFLEVWATAGFWALLALVGALAWGLWNLLGRGDWRKERGSDARPNSRASRRDSRRATVARRCPNRTMATMSSRSTPAATGELAGRLARALGGWALGGAAWAI